jgi:putative nucleotidyltransferase with HDIG domain
MLPVTCTAENKPLTDVAQILNEIKVLRPVPPVAAQILELAESPESSMTEIADLILHDPAVTANLLRLCNSAYFGVSPKVESVKQAIALLGLDQLVEVVVLSTLSAQLINKKEVYGLQEGDLWRHAAVSAHVAKILAKKNGNAQNTARIFTGALLKDIGKLILGRFVAASLEKISILVMLKRYNFDDAEKEVIGMSHAELGAMLAEHWQFSERLVYMIRHHHLSDESARGDLETALIYLADIICMMMRIGAGVDALAYKFHSDVLMRTNLTVDDLQAVMVNIRENRSRIEKLLNII